MLAWVLFQVVRPQPFAQNADNAARCDAPGGDTATAPASAITAGLVHGDRDGVQAASRVFPLPAKLVLGSLDADQAVNGRFGGFSARCYDRVSLATSRIAAPCRGQLHARVVDLVVVGDGRDIPGSPLVYRLQHHWSQLVFQTTGLLCE